VSFFFFSSTSSSSSCPGEYISRGVAGGEFISGEYISSSIVGSSKETMRGEIGTRVCMKLPVGLLFTNN
jgi:hypothetical protein